MTKQSSIPKWQIMENVVAACERIHHHDVTAVIEQKIKLPVLTSPKDFREIDVLVSIEIGARKLIVGVQVKDWKRKIHVGDLSSLVDVREEVGLDRLCIVATGGYTDPAKRKAERDHVDIVELEQIPVTGVFQPFGQTLVFETGGHIEHVQFNYPKMEHTPELLNSLANIRWSEFEIEFSNGRNISLLDALSNVCMQETQKLDPPLVQDQPFNLNLTGLRESWSGLHFKGSSFPIPESIWAKAKYVSRPINSLIVRLFGLDILTFQTAFGGQLSQISIAMVPTSDGSGAKQVVVSSGPAKRKPSKRNDK